MVGGLSWGYVGPSWGYVCLSWRQCGPILGLCWPILGLCWPILGAMLPHLEAMSADLEAYVGPCWPILSHKIRKWGKMGTAKYIVKRGTFWWYRVGRSAAGAVAPLSFGEERRPTAMPRPRGPRGPLAGFKRLRATAGQGPMLRWYGSSWEQDLKAMLLHREALKKHCKTQDILIVWG